MSKLTFLNNIEYIDEPSFASYNSDDKNNFQVFTPSFIVDEMIFEIGINNILNYEKTILEPTSGDGAFTCKILSLRLNKIKKIDKNILAKSLRALSTIYSIESDYKLIAKQKNNIYTILLNFLKSKKISFEKNYELLAKEIINSNFYWAEFNKDLSPLIPQIATYLEPKMKNKEVQFKSFQINDDLTYDVIDESIELW